MLLPYRSDGELDYARAVMPLAVREHAVELSRPYAPHSGLWSVPQALALFHHVRNLAYIADPLGVDAYVQEPEVTLRMGAGNCEAKAALLCSLWRAVGISSRMMLLGNGSSRHLFTQLWIGTYNLFDVPDDLAFYDAPQWLRRQYAHVVNSQYREHDAAGGQWVFADPVLSSFVGDVAGLVEYGFMSWSEAGITWTNACYFSDGTAHLQAIPGIGTVHIEVLA